MGVALILAWLRRRGPFFFSTVAFLGGVILLISGATPEIQARLALAYWLLPDPLVELSHFLGSVVGTGLLILAWGLGRRLRDAYLLSVYLLGGGSVLLLLKGLEYGPALTLLILLLLLRQARTQFDRKASLMSEPFTLVWAAAIVLVVGGSIWLLFFSFQHVPYSHDLWWQVALGSDASRSMRATVGSVVTVAAFALVRLFRAAAPIPTEPGPAELAAIAATVQRHPAAEANLALLGDKQFFFNASQSAFIMYGTSGRSCVAMGDPVGPARDAGGIIRAYVAHCRRHERIPVFYEVSERHLGHYLEAGLAVVKIGEQGRVPLQNFSPAGKDWEDVRYRHRRCLRAGCTFELVPPEDTAGRLDELQRISDAWMVAKRAREFGFSLGYFDPAYVGKFWTAIVRRQETVIAFATLWQSGGKEEVEVDLARYVADAPPGLMYFIMLELMTWAARENVGWFNLGMAPLAGLESVTGPTIWNTIGKAVFRLGEPLYQFQGLRQFKNKFNPIWRSRYLASPGGLRRPTILANIATLIRRRH